MARRSFFRLCLIASTFALIASALPAAAQKGDFYRGRKYKAPPPTAHIVVTVLRNDNDKPILNAAVVFETIVHGKETGNMELKTNENGKVVIDLLPIGELMQLQVLARGYQTFGHDYQIDKKDMAITVRLKLPQGQYSVYKKH